MCKVSNHRPGCKCSPPSQLGRKRSAETRALLSASHSGPRPWRVGVPIDLRGARHHHWRGDSVGYNALHSWLRRAFGLPLGCDNDKCRYPRLNYDGELMLAPKRYEWANYSGMYLRFREDWLSLCSSCHRLFDNGTLVV